MKWSTEEAIFGVKLYVYGSRNSNKPFPSMWYTRGRQIHAAGLPDLSFFINLGCFLHFFLTFNKQELQLICEGCNDVFLWSKQFPVVDPCSHLAIPSAWFDRATCCTAHSQDCVWTEYFGVLWTYTLTSPTYFPLLTCRMTSTAKLPLSSSSLQLKLSRTWCGPKVWWCLTLCWRTAWSIHEHRMWLTYGAF